MASIFTFDPDPPRVSSPWATSPPAPQPRQTNPQESKIGTSRLTRGADRIRQGPFGSAEHASSITKLEAEPQEGPTEYKLHLLLRRRRSFTRTTTGRHVSGSLRRTETLSTNSGPSRSVSESNVSNTPPPLSSTHPRQHRLEQLTTQLLWRLQQSCPYHISSSNALVLPHLPDASQLSAPSVPQRILPGLEETKGALYEIGVADDGTIVGLAEDEMEESLNNLRAMAASLGCRVEVLRMVDVGECEWIEAVERAGIFEQQPRKGKLWVAEAFVRPDQAPVEQQESASILLKDSNSSTLTPAPIGHASPGADKQRPTEHLRISLTGPTMSGKSSLLGSLSTATLDNGRGKSRLSLLKHRHEIVSGMTSSVTQELIGYFDRLDQDGNRMSSRVISYGAGNVSSWLDIHAAAEGGRLVFLSDSAGHPRYRRTTVRGLVGWSPHWTLLCIPADSSDDSSTRAGTSSSGSESVGPPPVDVDLSHAHLQLCLNLELPLVVVITKLDVATKSGLRQTLSKLLSTLKVAGKKPYIVPNDPNPVVESQLTEIMPNELFEARTTVGHLNDASSDAVPILLTSAVKGTGINKLHAMLRELPIPISPDLPNTASYTTVFHIEDIYNNIIAPSKPVSINDHPNSSEGSIVIGGLVSHGSFQIGDELFLGPYPVDQNNADDSDSGTGGTGKTSTPPSGSRARRNRLPASRSFPGALHKQASLLAGMGSSATSATADDRQAEWRRVRITSLRNLRLPVRRLLEGQVGTVGVAPLDMPISSPALVRIRKGMALVDGKQPPKAKREIEVRFEREKSGEGVVKGLGVGSAVVVYVASVRASARVVSLREDDSAGVDVDDVCGNEDHMDEDGGFGFGFDVEDELTDNQGGTGAIIVTFQFVASREFVEEGAKVLVLPGGGPVMYGGEGRGEKGVAGLDGYVGRVVKGGR